MAIPERTLRDSPAAQLQWMVTDDGSYTLLDTQTGETFHSGCGAVAESAVVYLSNSGVADRLRADQPTRLLEVGFGTGTAFLLTAALAEWSQTPLRYFALEGHLLPRPVFEQLELSQRATEALKTEIAGLPEDDAWLQTLPSLHAEWMQFRQEIDAAAATAGSPWQHKRLTPSVELILWLDDAREFTWDIFANTFDAIYFDPFSPATNPELWSPQFLQHMFDLLVPGGRLTSYCVKGTVRRAFQQVGFDVAKAPGPEGGKREVLVTSRPAVR